MLVVNADQSNDIDENAVSLQNHNSNDITHSSSDAIACLNAKLEVRVKTELPVLISLRQIQSSELTDFNGLISTSAPTK